MNSKVTLDFLDPNSDTAVFSSIELPFNLTNAYKYISTMGHPATARGSLGVESATAARLIGAHISTVTNPEVCAGGLVCLGSDLTGKPFFDHKSQLVGYGTRYSTDMSAISSKYGAKLINNTVMEPGHFRQAWEFATNQALGNIKSIALTHQVGAHAIDNEDFTTDMTLAVGKDFSLLTDAQDAPCTVIDGTTPMNAGSGSGVLRDMTLDHIKRFYAYNTSDSTSLKMTFYYQTEKFVFLCRAVSINVQNSQNNYVTTFKYKKIAKDDINLYFDNSTPLPSFSKLSCENSDSDEFYCDGSFEINSGTAQLRMVGGSANSTQGYILRQYAVQNCAYLAFPAFYSGSAYPSYDNGYNTSYTYAARIYFVSGDTPTVSMEDTVYKSPLGHCSSSNYGINGILFLEDKSFIVSRAYSTGSRYYFYRAKVANSELIWKVNLPSNVYWRAACLLDTKDSFALVQPAVTTSNTVVYRCQIRNVSDGALEGSALYELPNSTDYALRYIERALGLVVKPSVSQSPFYFKSSEDSPFIISTRRGATSTTGYNYSTVLKTNYVFGYAVLPNILEKTNAFRLRVTVDVYFN